MSAVRVAASYITCSDAVLILLAGKVAAGVRPTYNAYEIIWPNSSEK